MLINSDSLRLLHSHPKEFKKICEDLNVVLPKRNIKEDLFINYIFEPDEIEEKFILDVTPPDDERIKRILDFVSREYIDITDNNLEDELEPGIAANVLADIAEQEHISIQEVNTILENNAEYFDFLMQKRNKSVISLSQVKEAKTLAAQLCDDDTFADIFRPATFRRNITEITGDADFTKLNPVINALSKFFWPIKIKESQWKISLHKDEVVTYLYRNMNVTCRLIPGAKLSNVSVPLYLDAINYHKIKGLSFGMFRYIDKSLGDLKDVLLGENGLFIEIGLLQNFLSENNLGSLVDQKTNLNFYVIDKDGYRQALKPSKNVIKSALARYEPFSEAIHWHTKTGNYTTYGRSALFSHT